MLPYRHPVFAQHHPKAGSSDEQVDANARLESFRLRPKHIHRGRLFTPTIGGIVRHLIRLTILCVRVLIPSISVRFEVSSFLCHIFLVLAVELPVLHEVEVDYCYYANAGPYHPRTSIKRLEWVFGNCARLGRTLRTKSATILARA
jgi:hypothetical protein